MTSTSDADAAPRRTRRSAAPAAEGAADAAPARRPRAAKAAAADAPPSADPAPAARPRRSRAKTDAAEAAPTASATAPTAASPAPKPRTPRTPTPRVATATGAAAAPPTATPAAPPPAVDAPPRRARSRAAATPAPNDAPAPAAPSAAPDAPADSGAPRRGRGRGRAEPTAAAPTAAAKAPDAAPRAASGVDDRGAPPAEGADARPEGWRPSRRRRRGRGDGPREPGGYAGGPVPPGGDVVRPRDSGQGGYGRDANWRGDAPRGDAPRSDGRGGQAEARRGGQPGAARYDGGRGNPPSSRYGGNRSATPGGNRGSAQGGSRYDGGRGGRFEGRSRGGARDRGREPQRPAGGEPEDWNAPVPGGLEAGGHAGAEWVSYEDRVAGEGGARTAGQEVAGFVELSKNGNGILRTGGLAGRNDPVVPLRLLRQHGLRSGDLVEGLARGTQVVEIAQVNGKPPADLARRPNFDQLTAVHPDKALLIGATADNLTGRLLDIVAPVGRGQRGLIVAPPKAGKTTLLKDIANGLAHDPRLTLIICLVGERPEEVTDMRRSTNCLVLAADMDLPTEDHTRVAEICVEHAKRLVEEGRHVVILMDSLTRLARAYNLSIKGGGSRTLSGGMDASALQPVRRFFGAARATEDGGSLTILATCLVDTGSRLDDLVYEEFKGTGNMEVHLDRKLSELRLFPAVDIRRSGTRREELLFDPQMLEQVRTLRRQLAPLEPQGALVAMLDALRKQPMPDGSLASR